jgi:hypothetical protein
MQIHPWPQESTLGNAHGRSPANDVIPLHTEGGARFGNPLDRRVIGSTRPRILMVPKLHSFLWDTGAVWLSVRAHLAHYAYTCQNRGEPTGYTDVGHLVAYGEAQHGAVALAAHGVSVSSRTWDTCTQSHGTPGIHIRLAPTSTGGTCAIAELCCTNTCVPLLPQSAMQAVVGCRQEGPWGKAVRR